MITKSPLWDLVGIRRKVILGRREHSVSWLGGSSVSEKLVVVKRVLLSPWREKHGEDAL